MNFVKTLIQFGAHINLRCNGNTPAFIAAQEGHATVIKELAVHGANLNLACDNGATPAIIAAQGGHATVIKELAVHGANLNLAMPNGVTPAFIAAQNGHAAVIAEFIKYNVVLNQPFISSVNFLNEFAKKRGGNITLNMDALIQKKLNAGETEDRITVYPHEIAHVMGHNDLGKIIDAAVINRQAVMDKYKTVLKNISNKSTSDTTSVQKRPRSGSN